MNFQEEEKKGILLRFLIVAVIFVILILTIAMIAISSKQESRKVSSKPYQNVRYKDEASKLGSKEYVCEGMCYCGNRRSTSIISKSLTVLVTSISTTVAYKYARDRLTEVCSTKLSDNCVKESISVDIQKCDRLLSMRDDDDEEEKYFEEEFGHEPFQINPDFDEDEHHVEYEVEDDDRVCPGIYECSGCCLPHKEASLDYEITMKCMAMNQTGMFYGITPRSAIDQFINTKLHKYCIENSIWWGIKVGKQKGEDGMCVGKLADINPNVNCIQIEQTESGIVLPGSTSFPKNM